MGKGLQVAQCKGLLEGKKRLRDRLFKGTLSIKKSVGGSFLLGICTEKSSSITILVITLHRHSLQLNPSIYSGGKHFSSVHATALCKLSQPSMPKVQAVQLLSQIKCRHAKFPLCTVCDGACGWSPMTGNLEFV